MTEESLFTAALEKSTLAERTAFLDEACAGDAELRERIEALIRSHEQAGEFLERMVPERPDGGLALLGDPGETPAEPPHEPDGVALDFLSPTVEPDGIGRLGHYEVLEVIGHGGMGVVLRARDKKLNRIVAIKVMAAQLATFATARKRFTNEAQAAAAVCHDHVVTIHEVEESGGRPYLVMQYVPGKSLQERLDQTGPLKIHEILRIGMQTAFGLAAAHAQGVVHRDVKPANILLENKIERVKITDFGLARAGDISGLTLSGVVVGTPLYMSPEQARGHWVDHRSDLFSLGSVLYAMCTGRAPFQADEIMATLRLVCEEVPRPIRDINAEVPEWLAAIIERLHAKNPAERYQTALEVAELLGRHLAQLQQAATAPLPTAASSPSPAKTDASVRVSSWRKWIVGIIALVCLLGFALVCLFGFLWWQPEPDRLRLLLVVAHRDFNGREFDRLHAATVAAGADVVIASSHRPESAGKTRANQIPDAKSAPDKNGEKVVVKPTVLLQDAKPGDFDGIIVCGGGASYFGYPNTKGIAKDVVSSMIKSGKPVAAGSGVAILAEIGVLDGHRVAKPSHDEAVRKLEETKAILVNDPLVISGGYITVRDNSDSRRLVRETLDFARKAKVRP